MNTYRGVVSTRSANAQLTTIDGQPTLFDFVVLQAGTPQFRFNPPLFASTPRPGCNFDLSSYGPDEPTCVPGSAVIWQYAEQCYKNEAFPKGLWDQDLATDTGYATMWGGQN